MQQVEQWVSASGLARSDVAHRAGVARSTMLRIAQGSVSPNLSTLREIAIACGLDIDVVARPLSDPAAAEAARVMLEDGYTASDPAAAAAWVARLERTGGADPVEIVRVAGNAASLFARRGAHYFTGRADLLRVASAGDGSRGPWAISGAPPLDTTGTIVLWADDPARAARLLSESLQPTDDPSTASVIVAPAHPGIYVDSWAEGPVRYVAPVQMLLDALGLEPHLRDAALEVARSW
jgi:transcriptional regulator with XRE-family HTH domain